jgi:NlpC/P60 family putative phage cell wall peptidase
LKAVLVWLPFFMDAKSMDYHDIVAEARSWVGTRFCHQGRKKRSELQRGGVDCLGLLVGIAEALDVRDMRGVPLITYDQRDYAVNPRGEALLGALCVALTHVPMAEATAGDIVLFAYEKNPQHLAVLCDYSGGGLGMIHAYAPARAVVEHALDASWRARMVAVFRVAG